MDQLKEIITRFNTEILLGLTLALFLLFILYLIAEIRISRLKSRYEDFTRGVKGINVEELLIKTGRELNDLNIGLGKIEKDIEDIRTRLAFAIQKVGFIRYNAFAEMGSDLSFSLALLDRQDNGIVITSIYGREYTTSYGKPIKSGKSNYPLSVEEIQAIDRAIRGENKEVSL